MSEQHACALCVSLYGDKKPKDTEWCERCKRWFCESCRKRYAQRGFAAVKAFLGV